ncbi:hypothetical protein [Streptomyces sp. NPDC006012]|uniref:hypothetical protein n=1 Tax=Streptomyces sp. NPDC006012 TaxID=3364739 RepID=UPI0036C6507A
MRPTARAVPPRPVLVAALFQSAPDAPAAAAGQPSVVSGPRAVPFRTEPLFRDHPKGAFAQLARALFAVAAVRGSSVEEYG